MRRALIEEAKQYIELQTELEEVKEKIERQKKETFGSESEDTAEKARELFTEVGSADDEPTTIKEIDELKAERNQLQEEVDEVREELQELLTDLRFPFNEKIEPENGTIRFPFETTVESEILDAISDVLDIKQLDKDEVHIGTDEITVDSDKVDEAIDRVSERVQALRDQAEIHYDAAKHVEDLHNRDVKVAQMLYVLRESDEPLTKSQMEERIGLESGELRGQLYHVLKNESYLNKVDKEVELTPTGQQVIDEYVSRYEPPPLAPSEPSDGEADEMEVTE